jgi:hypothetical protein
MEEELEELYVEGVATHGVWGAETGFGYLDLRLRGWSMVG